MITFACRCGKQLTVKDEFAGKRGSCPHCKQPVVVPGALEVTAPQPDDTPSSPEGDGAKLDFLAPPQAAGELGRLGAYRVLKVLGAGGMGLVLQAEDPTLRRLVALKVMRPELAAKEVNRQRFLREAQATAAVEHPYIVHILHVGQENRVPFLAMPFLKGEPLDARLKREKKLPVAEAVRIARQTAEGLAAAHKNGLVHRDIKPGNLWLEADTGWVKILDFGLARITADDTQLTKSGAILGTPAYMAPEQAAAKPVDFRCDLFSLGAVLYRMLTAETPFKGADTLSLITALVLDTPRPVRELNAEVPAALNDLVMQLLAKKPEERPPSAKAVAEILGTIEGDQTQMLPGRAGSRQRPEEAPPPRGVLGALTRPRSPGHRVLGGLLFLLRQLWRLYRIPGRLGWCIRGGTLLALLLLIVLLPRGSHPDDGPPTPTRRASEGEPENPYTNTLGMKMVLVPKGKFLMGGGGGNAGTNMVEIKHDFYMGQYELTQWEWQQVMGSNPSSFATDPSVKPLSPEERAKLPFDEARKLVAAEERAKERWWKAMPVEQVTWDDAQVFVKRLNEKESKPGWVYRLPLEAEWEYACRGAPRFQETPAFWYSYDFYFKEPTNTLLPDLANFNFGEKALQRTSKVGSYPPNRLGLYDMHGNVWEWCQDEVKDDKGASRRVDRGGGWSLDSGCCRAAVRYPHPPSSRSYNLGLRLARVSVGGGPVSK